VSFPRDHEDLFAATNGVATLYKFRSYRTDDDKNRVHQILLEHRAYFARASELNDPFDLTPRIANTTREELLRAADDYFTRQALDQRDRALEHLRTVDVATHVAEATAKARARIEDDYPVFSLAGNRDHPMLWSHYADGHRGLCIHFRSDDESIFGVALRVDYVDERPCLPIDVRSLSERDAFERAVLKKGRAWSHEQEYRFFRLPRTDWSPLPIRFDGQFGHFPSGFLSGISVGARMPQADFDVLVKIAHGHSPRLPVWRAVENDTFAFDFELVR
jgi:hypothetical protein